MSYLLLSILCHAALGVALAGVVWLVGLGWLRLVPARAAFAPVDAYPLGVLAVVLAALGVLASWWLAPLAALLLLPVVRAPVRVLAPALRPLTWAFAPAVGLPIALGFLLHGPTSELDSSAYGDMLYYVNKIVSASGELVPFRDLLAEGQQIIYAEGAPSYVGAVLSHLPGFDVVLVQTTTMPAYLLVSFCAGLGLAGGGPRSRGGVLAVALIATGLTAYPTWITESPPVAMSIPLAFSIHRLLRARIPTGWLLGLTTLTALALFVTKVLALLPFGIVVAFVLWGRRRSLDRRLVVAALAALAAALVALLFATAAWYTRLVELDFAPADAARGLWRQLSTRDTHAAAPGFAIVGQLVLLAVLVRIRAYALACALGVSVGGSWFVGGQLAGLDIAIATSIVLAALELWARPEAFARVRGSALAAGVLLTLSAWFRDISGVRAGLVFVVLLAAALVAAFGAVGGLRRIELAYVVAAAAVVFVVGMAGRSFVAFLVAVALVAGALAFRRAARPALAAGVLTAGVLAVATDLRLSDQNVTLSTHDYEVWRRVAEVVPADGLVFTSLTGEVVDGRHGWNNYPSIAGRQLYIAGWYDGELVSRPEERDRRLALNERVLTGGLSPAELDLDRNYSSFWAVVWTGAGLPPGFRRVYANELFSLYRIPA